MYTDFNNFFTVRTRNLWRIKTILRLPPHLHSVTALPSKTYTTANIDAHVWLIDVMARRQPQKNNCNVLNKQYFSEDAVFNMFLYFTGVLWLQGASSWLHIMSWNIDTLSAVLRDLGRPLPDFRSVDPQLSIFFSQTIHTCHRPSLVRKLFLLGVWPPFFAVRRRSMYVDYSTC